MNGFYLKKIKSFVELIKNILFTAHKISFAKICEILQMHKRQCIFIKSKILYCEIVQNK